jgi:hypothetical protein
MIDQEQLRAERQRAADAARESDWAERERLAVEAMRADHARQREAEQHQRQCQAYARFATARAAVARSGDDAKVWTDAATNIGKDDPVWIKHPTIDGEPAVTAHQALRTRLGYLGKIVRFAE